VFTEQNQKPGMTNTNLDYIIVGQGLAGSILAFELLENGCKVKVFDPGSGNSSSLVAAGIFNPLIAKRLTLTWMAETLTDFNYKYYPALEARLDQKFFHPLQCWLAFASVAQQNDWEGRLANPQYLRFINDKSKSAPHAGLDFKFGGIQVKDAGYLDTKLLLTAFTEYFRAQNCLVTENLDADKLELTTQGVVYKELSATKIIYCDGYHNSLNRFFSYLPYKLVKGEVIDIFSEELKLDCLYQKGIYIVPLGNAHYRVGATYQWEDLNETTTAAGKNWLHEKLNEVIKVPYSFVSQGAGIRPATYDRRPFLGSHPLNKQVMVFGGWGSKGVFLIPYFAQHMAQQLLHNHSIMKEVNIERVKR